MVADGIDLLYFDEPTAIDTVLDLAAAPPTENEEDEVWLTAAFERSGDLFAYYQRIDHEAADPRPDSMGFVTPGCIVEVHGADGNEAPPEQIGEIVVGGEPGLTLFAGYLDDHDTTAANFRDGWFLTGDRASRDATGRWFFDGRRSDVLKVAGENVSTVEVEAVVTSHPAVLEASVVGPTISSSPCSRRRKHG